VTAGGLPAPAVLEVVGRWRPNFLTGHAIAVYLFFYLPILTIFLFAFDPKPIPGWPIESLTVRWFGEGLQDPELLGAVWASFWIAMVSAALATVLGIPAAMALAWLPIPGKRAVMGLIVGPIIVPPIVLGLGLLLLFRQTPGLLGPLGVVVAHTTLNVAFSTLILYSRLLGFRRSLIEAAMDLGATELRTFLEVILPLSFPAIAAAFLLAFTGSFGEFVVAWFVAGFSRTLPIEIWTWLRYILSPKINAIATLIMIISITLSVTSQVWILRQARSAVRQ
jgi:ABC-type spermidine/putrescine transport system permease subunit II